MCGNITRPCGAKIVRFLQIRVIIKKLSHGGFANAARPAGNFVANNGLAFLGAFPTDCFGAFACRQAGRLLAMTVVY